MGDQNTSDEDDVLDHDDPPYQAPPIIGLLLRTAMSHLKPVMRKMVMTSRLPDLPLRPQNQHVFQAQVLVMTKRYSLMLLTMMTITKTLSVLWSMTVMLKLKVGQMIAQVVRELTGDENLKRIYSLPFCTMYY